ncbi:hypothetical protein C0991_000731 [Blastosporella zonata]|nr:hypothetical protein C0991_000731 [Blastosporella zonata]
MAIKNLCITSLPQVISNLTVVVLSLSKPHSEQTPEQNNDKPETHWYDDKEKLGFAAVGGGIAASLFGVGVHHFMKKHENEEEGRVAWVNEARARTNQFHREGPKGPATWVLAQGKDFPSYAIKVGDEHSQPLYICRAYHEGGKQIGAASATLSKGAVVGFKHKEYNLDVYEILLGNMSGLRWVPAHGKVDLSALGHSPVEGGHENDGSPLYIIRAIYKGSYYPGKASATLDGTEMLVMLSSKD